MSARIIEIDQVRISLTAGRIGPERSRRISQLTLDHVNRLMADRIGELAETVDLNYLGVEPVRVRFEVMDDETIARETAFQIYRALLQEF